MDRKKFNFGSRDGRGKNRKNVQASGWRNTKLTNTRARRNPEKRACNKRHNTPILQAGYFSQRGKILLGIMVLMFFVVVGYSVWMQFNQRAFLQSEGEKRFEVTIKQPAVRGRIEDANGLFLATSIPVRGAWMIPDELDTATPEQLKIVSDQLGLSIKAIKQKIENHRGKTFVYLKRQVPTPNTEVIKEAKVPGINFLPEVKRIYPQGPLMAHLVGFTNIENTGIEGLEKELDGRLKGKDGKLVVLRDRLGHVIEDMYQRTPVKDGEKVQLTIDSQLQLITYQAVEEAVKEHNAEAGAAVVVDTRTGEILSMVSYPSYDPNDPFARKGAALRNRAITDTFEPGSIIKPLVAALALDSGAITENQMFNTGHGSYVYQGHTITDVSKWNGTLNVAGIIRRSSNIGMTMISEHMNNKQMWTVFNALGFGQRPDIGFPGAAKGRLRPYKSWKPIEKATMSYGYGISVSLLQMAHAYTTLARDGDLVPLKLIKGQNNDTHIQVYSPKVARSVRNMLEAASGPTGTKIQAKVEGYRIGGKSGTARKIINGAYSRSQYRGSFVAVAPISDPHIVVAATIDNPRQGGYYGTLSAGPVVARIIENSLKHLGVTPDRLKQVPTLEAKSSQQGSNHG